MRVCAVVAEFNPFHNGHKYLFDEIRKMGFTHVVVVMSGNFVQRGEPAIIPKEYRVYPALHYGADLVIELPCVWAISVAERFARAAVYIINSIKCVEAIVFGSECGNIEQLNRVAELVERDDFKLLFKKYIKTGVTYARAVEMSVCELSRSSNIGNILTNPNNILGVEYIKTIKKSGSNIVPMTIKINNSEKFFTASDIRRMLKSKNTLYERSIPKVSLDCMSSARDSGFGLLDFFYGEKVVLYKLKDTDKSYIRQLPDVGEGIENRILNSISSSCNLGEALNLMKTKRYTMARIKRILLFLLLGITDKIQKRLPPYLRIFGMSEKGREILKFVSLPVLSRFSDVSKLSDFSNEVYKIECRSTDCIGIFSESVNMHESERKFKIIKVNRG